MRCVDVDISLKDCKCCAIDVTEKEQAGFSEARATEHYQASFSEKIAASHSPYFECMIEKLKTGLPWQHLTTSFSRRRVHDQVAEQRCVGPEDTKIDIDVQVVDNMHHVVGPVADEGDKKRIVVGPVDDEDVDMGSGSGVDDDDGHDKLACSHLRNAFPISFDCLDSQDGMSKEELVFGRHGGQDAYRIASRTRGRGKCCDWEEL